MTAQTATRTEVWTPANTFGSRLRHLRYELGMTVEEIAPLCDFPVSTWSTWERGARPRRMDEVVRKISDATNVDRDWLMWGASNPEGGHTQETPTSAWVTADDALILPFRSPVVQDVPIAA